MSVRTGHVSLDSVPMKSMDSVASVQQDILALSVTQVGTSLFAVTHRIT